MDEDWEQDLDVDLTEEDMKAAEELAKKLGENVDLDVSESVVCWQGCGNSSHGKV